MTNRIPYIVVIAATTVAVAIYLWVFNQTPKRPLNGPLDAVFVKGDKTGWWQSCSIDESTKTSHCRVFNSGGKVLVDEEFLPYDGGPLPNASELILDPKNRYSDVYRVGLKNGRILLPKSMYTQSKKLLDSLER